MQQATPSFGSHHGAVFAGLGHFFTPKRVGLAAAGTLAFLGTGAAFNSPSASLPALHAKDSSSSVSLPGPVQSLSVTGGASSSGNKVKVNVNGKDIPVPDNGSVQQTVPTSDGSGNSTVTVNSNQGGSFNDSSSSLNVTINSSSTTSGGSSSSSTMITDDGGTTIITTP